MGLEHELVEAIVAEFRYLREQRGADLSEKHFEQLELGKTSRKTFLNYPRGGPARLNPDHPVVKRLMKAVNKDRSRLYYLLSATYSIINRELEELHDDDERRFHAKLLEALLDGREGEWSA